MVKQFEEGVVFMADELDGFKPNQFETGVNEYYDKWVNNGKFIENYGGADIFEYPDILGEPQYTFWYGRSESQYISSVKSIGEARAWIDRNGVQTS